MSSIEDKTDRDQIKAYAEYMGCKLHLLNELMEHIEELNSKVINLSLGEDNENLIDDVCNLYFDMIAKLKSFITY